MPRRQTAMRRPTATTPVTVTVHTDLTFDAGWQT